MNTAPRSFLGKCKSCKRHLQIDGTPAETVEPVVHAATGRTLAPRRVSWALGVVRSPLAAAWNGKWQVGLPCPRCAAPMMVQAVAGTVSPEHVCGARCLASTGPTCECSCGGKNHGKSHAA